MVPGPGDRVDKGGFALPPFPRDIGLDPVLASLLHCATFLEFSDDDVVDPDSAVEVMEQVAAYLSTIDEPAKTSLPDQLARASRYAGSAGTHHEPAAALANPFSRSIAIAAISRLNALLLRPAAITALS